MASKAIRPYEISIWTLQDSFITVLKPSGVEVKGQLITPKFSLKDNVMTFDFSIPMYYRDDAGEMILNPYWHSTQDGTLIANLRKAKVILNKGEEEEGVFEFLIHKVTESHNSGQLFCDVSCEGLAFEELGKIGYKLSLNYDEYLLDLDAQEEGAEYFPTLNYWADKIFKNTNWTYSIQMDWSTYDGIVDFGADNTVADYEKMTQAERDALNTARENAGLRRRDKIYEEEYVSSWKLDEVMDKLIPEESIEFQEKARIPEIEKSNIYNITQELAELFGVFVKYKYHYDENYHIIGRECVFYNTYLDEKEGKFDINYAYQTSEITRLIESNDVITKMYVPITEDNSIVDVLANKSKEDYILNFDYLRSIGTITEEQYNEIEPYERTMYRLNTDHANYSDKKASLDLELVDLKAEETVLNNSIIYAQEQIGTADDFLKAITNDTGELHKTMTNPELVMILPDSAGGFKVNLSLEGIQANTIKLYTEMENSEVVEGSRIENFEIVSDSNGNVVGLANIQGVESGRAYVVCDYRPSSKYDNIKKTFEKKLADDQKRLNEVEARLAEIETNEYPTVVEKLDEIERQQTDARADFEKMMGPALREGSWETEDTYLDYGDHNTATEVFFSDVTQTIVKDKVISTLWDTELFDGEEKNYIELGVDMQKQYRKIFALTPQVYSALKENNILNSASIRYEIPYASNVPPQIDYLGINSSFVYAFLLNASKKPIPVIMLLKDDLNDGATNFEIGSVSYKEANQVIDFTAVATLSEVPDAQSFTIAYPRIVFNSLDLKTAPEELIIYQNNQKLTKYEDYSLLLRDEKYYATIKSLTFIMGDLLYEDFAVVLSRNNYDIDYILSNANLHLYLDALEVSKTNAFPKVSYTVSVAPLDKEFIKYSYLKLNRIANINDSDLMLENVQGYISGIEMDLDKPWEDTFTIQNYKTKFEDLFSRIVASTEAMQQNKVSYDRAGSAFTTTGGLVPSVIQNTLNTTDLNYSFNNGKLTINEMDGIWAESDEGVVAMRGGGIFCATEKDPYGNWLWNTGIIPSGINASMINAGTINTNLIRIYSGDNIRFQMNGDGLFAYAPTADGSANFDKYVVHDSEGLFLTENVTDGAGNSTPVDLVEVSWDGLKIRNKENKEVFYADPDGNLTIVGNLTAETGKIGQWNISDSGLVYQSPEGSAALLPPSAVENNTDPIFWVGDNFSVDKSGTLKASGAIIEGTLVAGTVVQLDNGSTPYLSSALKRMDIVPIGAGNEFKRYNNNYDDNIIEDPNSLRFIIASQNFQINNASNLSFTVDGNELVIEEDSNSNIYWEDKSKFIFIVKIGFMGEAEKKTIIASYNDTAIIQTELVLTLEQSEINKRLSEIDPYYYNFTGAGQTKDFSVTLKNFGSEEHGQWYLNNTPIESRTEVVDGKTIVTAPINSNSIEAQATLRYTINNVSREALISKTITPQNEITLVVESSNGIIFKNGVTATTLTAVLYQNGEVINSSESGAPYGYVWKKNGEKIPDAKIKKLMIDNGDFTDKSIYTCDVYETQEEAENVS